MPPPSHDWNYFERLAAKGGWGAGRNESASGTGSSMVETQVLRARLAQTLRELNVRSLVDAPCGDMNWMRHLDYQFEKFIGVDIAPTLIENLRQQEFPPHYHFQVGNVATDILPAADALFCRDCLVHLPNDAVLSALRLWKLAGFKFVLTTTFPGQPYNSDMRIGGWRAVNLEIAPFNWSNPLMVFLEEYPDPAWSDKSIGVWAL